MNQDVSLFLKGLAMGAANVIPGVSGGTIALITGIYERLIRALKSCDITAIKLLLTRDFSGLWKHIDGRFLSAIMIGVIVSIVSLAKLFEYLLRTHERFTMAFFFGLILLSLYYVAKQIKQWNASTIIALVVGTVIAVGIAMLAPASENDAFAYVFFCGVIAISSMILPGLSGSFVLIILGNYALVLGAISSFNLSVLIPLALGCGIGLILFANILAWVFKHYEDQTLATMTGFVLGSLVVIWPWKNALMQTITRPDKPPKEVVASYEWFWPNLASADTLICIGLMIVGAVCIWLMEKVAGRESTNG
jgi:putative membrane protein